MKNCVYSIDIKIGFKHEIFVTVFWLLEFDKENLQTFDISWVIMKSKKESVGLQNKSS